MQSPAWFTERSRAEWNGFRAAATPLGLENLETQPWLPETAPQYIISFEKFVNSEPLRASPILGSETGAPSPEPWGSLAKALARTKAQWAPMAPRAHKAPDPHGAHKAHRGHMAPMAHKGSYGSYGS